MTALKESPEGAGTLVKARCGILSPEISYPSYSRIPIAAACRPVSAPSRRCEKKRSVRHAVQ